MNDILANYFGYHNVAVLSSQTIDHQGQRENFLSGEATRS